MSLYCAIGGVESDIFPQLQGLFAESLAKLGPRSRVLVVPPDQSRVHSRAGDLTRYAWEYYGERLQAVLPALGTHSAMQREQIARMFGAMPQKLFRVHNWRTDVETLGEVPGAEAALAALDAIAPDDVSAYQPYWAVRAHVLQRLRKTPEALDAFDRAIGLTEDPAVRQFLLQRRG